MFPRKECLGSYKQFSQKCFVEVVVHEIISWGCPKFCVEEWIVEPQQQGTKGAPDVQPIDIFKLVEEAVNILGEDRTISKHGANIGTWDLHKSFTDNFRTATEAAGHQQLD